MSAPIEDYALLGDTESAALVTKSGSIDWLCLPRFDSGSCFAALLGGPEHGRWLLAPAEEVKTVRRRYWPGTLVLETEFECASGRVRVVDAMPPRGISGRPDVVRLVEGISGQVAMRMDLRIRFDYGWIVPWVSRDGQRMWAVAGPDALTFYTPVPYGPDEGNATTAAFSVDAGERVPFELVWYRSFEQPPKPAGGEPAEAVTSTAEWWREWSGYSQYQERWKEAVDRSLITLKALTNAPTGGIVAAPTTSLPEQIGGERNWDYRYGWLRDAARTLSSLVLSGFRQEAVAWRDWLLRAAAGDPANLQIMYGVGGEHRLPELIVDWLPGYEASTPVRIGNGAYWQKQHDVYGEVMDVMHFARRSGLEHRPESWELQRALLEYLESDWFSPDKGIWETRGERRHFTHSKVMAWVAFDRAVKAVEETGLAGPVDRWRQLRDTIHDEVCAHGYDVERNTFTQSYGSRELDATALLMPQLGFLPPTDQRMVGTVDAVLTELAVDDPLMRRYETGTDMDPLSSGEGAFLFCSFWLVDALMLMGRYDAARWRFERLLDLRNDVGLLAEQYDPAAGRQLGNFPQAFSHVGLIDSACNLTWDRCPVVERAA